VPQATTPAAPETIDPTVDADGWLDQRLDAKVAKEQVFNETLINTGVALIDADAAVQIDPTLKDEIIQEIQSGQVVVYRAVDPKMAAQIAVTQAKANILTRRMSTPTNPLEATTPATVPLGGVTPPAAPTKPKVELPPMSDYAKDAMKKWNISPEEAVKILNEP
jgi:hypothetical protein